MVVIGVKQQNGDVETVSSQSKIKRKRSLVFFSQ